MRGKCVSDRTVRLLTLPIVAVCGSASAAAAQTTNSAIWDANTDPHTVGYRVFGGVASGAYTWSVDVGNATSAALPPLSPGSSYYFVVRAYNAAGELGPASNEASLDLGGPPSMPRGVSASTSGSLVTLSWSPPVGGSPVTHYLLFVGTAPGASDLVNGVPVGNVLSVSGTVVPNRYYARVQAVNGYGVGPTSFEISFVVGGPGQPGNPSGLSVSWSGTVATLTWNPGSGATSYYIEAGSAAGATDVPGIEVGAATQYVVDVPPGTYFVRVRATSATGVSGPSNEIVVQGRGAPEPPTSLSASGTNGAVDLRWFSPTSGPRPSGYVLEAGSGPGLTDVASGRVGPETTFSTTAPPDTYYVRVRSLNARGVSAPSNEIIVRR